jgi:Polysaccharide deacetylase.
MVRRLAFRFDIDTHKCIRDGVPKLLDISRQYDVPFTFFLNAGKAVSILDSLKKLYSKKSSSIEQYEMMSAMQKLGKIDYMIAAFTNPKISDYKSQIKRLLISGCEVGLHGGKNHSLWGGNSACWTIEKVREEVKWALNALREIEPHFMPKGFASPEWNSPECLSEILKELGFSYYADLRCLRQDPVKIGGTFPLIGVNLLGEPGGVAFFESCRVRNMTDDEIVHTVFDLICELETVILYDHPYYAGLNEAGCICRLIETARDNKIQICKL